MTIDEYLSKLLILKDELAAIGQEMKESEVILITLGGLSEEYKAFVTAIATHYDPNLTFSELCKMLLDHDLRTDKRSKVNVTTKSSSSNQTPNLNHKSEIKCQICSRKEHLVADCYNLHNITQFPPSYGRTLSPLGSNGNNHSSSHSANTVVSSLDVMTMWYLTYYCCSRKYSVTKSL